ncbi:TetR family transcriptional regulator [Alcaligenes nematophilus]|uniref:TetR/AcrR family transcriptional regulator n=1 Tax=Alcaligenes TaxID=507 RepID=UPI0010CA4BCF|nr:MULTISPECIES: TetR/AcrR family transcriptional regulator [Alcaligenes]MCB4322586.1 TetR family transcriptional regulator [Alcaligenes sp. 13f]MDK7585865.1 TetR/AcrR family transcriptional regulator [Alcaligenes phenolicus]QCP82714.1 TetR/AcrR family transcriptional regulator [Alcaligenes faecalis]QFY79662.1 TetR/AcrR family transcriptional regulator [Alcaligenes faecalis]
MGRVTLSSDSSWVKRDKPGRPEGVGDNTSERILDAAEEEFSETGYAGTTLRVIAQKAAVTQALINYYFGSKYGLFEAVFIRRGKTISDERLRRLHALRDQDGKVLVDDVVRAFLAPTIALRETPGGRRFLRLQARLHTEPAEISYKLRNEAYDGSTRAYVQILEEILPELQAKDVYWRVVLMIGAYMYAFSDTHRLEELAPGICDPNNTDEILEQIIAFVSAGLLAAPVVLPGKA